MKNLIFIALTLSALGCTMAPKSGTPGPREIDIEALKQDLGLDRSAEDLGFTEKTFDSCEYEPSPQPNCGRKHLVVVHFRLQCRDSVGTVNSVSQIELMPVSSRHVRWRAGYFSGTTNTDSEGYGQVQFISPGSSKNQRFILQINENSLGVRASEVSRIIVPRDWCG